MKLLDFLSASFVSAKIAEKKIKKAIDNIWENNKEIDLTNKDYFEIKEKFDRYFNKGLDNKKIIEDKAKSNLIGITLSFSVIFAGFSFLMQNNSFLVNILWLKILVIFVLLISVFYLLLCGWSALQSLTVEKFYDLNIDDELRLSRLEKLSHQYKHIKINTLVNVIRTNYLFVSQLSLKYGIVLLGFVIVANSSLLFFNNESHQNLEPSKSVNNEINYMMKNTEDNIKSPNQNIVDSLLSPPQNPKKRIDNAP